MPIQGQFAHRRYISPPQISPPQASRPPASYPLAAAPLATFALALLVLALLGPAPPVLAGPARTEASATSTTAASPQGARGGAEAAPSVRWYRDVGPALAEAERSQRLVLVDLYAEWCGWCKKLDVEFKTDHFRRWAQDYVLLRVDVEDGGEGTELQAHLGVQALPTTALIDHDKVRVGTFKGFKPAPQLTRSLDGEVARYRARRARLAEQAKSSDNAERLAAADEMRSMYAGADAAAIYRAVLATPNLPADTRARVGAAITDALLMAGEVEAARGSLATARRDVARIDRESRFRTERLLDNLSLRIAEEMEECEQVGELETFLAQHPASTYADQVKDRLDDLKPGCS